jgi:ABC-type glycerol-3-phosphate transport system permease component
VLLRVLLPISWPALTTLSVLIVIAPIVLVYLIFQRCFVNGITQGAVKG